MNVDPNAPILVTGSAGSIGRAAVLGLRGAGRRVRGFDRVASPNLTDFIVGDLADREALSRAAAETAAIVHLAACPDDADFLSCLLPSNLVGLHNVLEAARVNAVRRVILASTGQVVWWQLLHGPWPVGVDVPYSPRDWYAVTKIAAEAAGQTYARNCGFSVLAVRLGWFPRTPDHAAELAATDRGPDLYFSPGDAGTFFRRAIEASLPPGFHVVYATSRPVRKAMFDLEPARRLLDWEPMDRWPTGAEQLVEASRLGG